jgi:hypothetical protein
MAEYKTALGGHGNTMYFKDGKMIKKSQYLEENKEPEEEPEVEPEIEEVQQPEPSKPRFDATASLEVDVVDLEGGFKNSPLHKVEKPEEVVHDEDISEYDPKRGECLFCGGDDEFQKVFHCDGRMYTVDLCGDHYYNKNLGKIVEQLRKGKINESLIR